MFSISVSGLGIRKASEVAVPVYYLSSVCATSTGVEAMWPLTLYLVKTTLSWNQLTKGGWPKRMGFIAIENKIKQKKKGQDYFLLKKNIQNGCSVHQLDYYRPHVLIV